MACTSRFTCSLALVALGFAGANAAEGRPPNIVHIIADDLGWNDVGFHGSEIETPALDRLAAESMVLNRFYVTPICSPTRAGVLAGRYPFRFGIWGGVVSPQKRHGLPPREVTTPEWLEPVGYRHRGLLGKWHLGLSSTRFHPLRHGFTEFYGHYNGAIDYFTRERHGQLDWHRGYASAYEEGYSTDLLGEEAVRFIERNGADGPFYLFVAFNAPHSPIQATGSDLAANGFDADGPRAANTDAGVARREGAPGYGERGKGNTVRQTFAAMTMAMDRNVGRILDALKAEGLFDDTLVIFHSDNGGTPKHGGNNRPLRGNKHTTWEGGVRVVALLRYPDRLPAGAYDGLTCYLDLLPTLSAAAGAPDPQGVDGINMMPFLESATLPPDRRLILGRDAVVSQRWKLVRGELFDLNSDPGEKRDLAKQHPEIVARLQAELERFDTLAGDPSESALPTPDVWPPVEWRLPEEP
ncbi:MAG: sulfatase-like hydrolase/transferase [Planctomycetota bacterium]